MTLQDLQEKLRLHIRARIGRGELTGIGLAQAADFPQGHLSNFLNARRGLSLESMDRLLATLGIGLLDLADKKELQKRIQLPGIAGVERIAMVAAENASLARFSPTQILDTRSFNKAFLHRLKPRYAEDRHDWQRFVVIKMKLNTIPLIALRAANTVLLIDRHYSSLTPYHSFRPNVYVVRVGKRCSLGCLSLVENYLLLQSRDPQQEVEAIPIDSGKGYCEYIVGRVCHIGLEV